MKINYELLLLARIYHDTEINKELISARDLRNKYHYKSIELYEAVNHCCELGLIDQIFDINKRSEVTRIYLNINKDAQTFVGSTYYAIKKSNKELLTYDKTSEPKFEGHDKRILEF